MGGEEIAVIRDGELALVDEIVGADRAAGAGELRREDSIEYAVYARPRGRDDEEVDVRPRTCVLVSHASRDDERPDEGQRREPRQRRAVAIQEVAGQGLALGHRVDQVLAPGERQEPIRVHRHHRRQGGAGGQPAHLVLVEHGRRWRRSLPCSAAAASRRGLRRRPWPAATTRAPRAPTGAAAGEGERQRSRPRGRRRRSEHASGPSPAPVPRAPRPCRSTRTASRAAGLRSAGGPSREGGPATFRSRARRPRRRPAARTGPRRSPTSRSASTSAAITGAPHAMASSSGRPNPSSVGANTNRSAPV